MNQKQLEIFKTLTETLNFTRTAEQLHLSQTTVTLQIHNLEEELGFKLFERTSRTVRPTPAGLVFYDGVNLIMDLFEQTIDNARITAQGYTGLLEIGFVDESNATGISDLIREFLKAHPRTRPKFYAKSPGELLDLLLTDQCDVIFTPSFDKLRSGNLNSCRIGNHRLIAAFHKDHPFSKKKELKYTDFAGENFIYVSNPSEDLDFTSEFAHQLEQNNVHMNTVARTDNINAVFFMIDADLGVTVIPEYFAERFYGTSNIRTCRIDEEMNGTDFLATWKDGKMSDELAAFLEFMKSYYADKQNDKA